MGMIIMNGKEYASAPKDGFPPIIYSDEEREIGVWRDSKPLYQRTIVCGALPSSKTAKSYTLNIENIDKIFILNTFAENSGVSFPGNTFRPENDGNGGFGCWLSVDNGNHIINFAADRDRSSYTGIVTICYTKTTDIPGSGKYTTYGGLAQHYSTNEQVIGTWVNGKPLYEKTVYCGDFTGTGNKTVAHNISNLGRVVKMFGAFNEGNTHFPLPIVMWGSAVTYQTRLAIDTTNIIISRDTAAQSVNLYVTLQYTKTTD